MNRPWSVFQVLEHHLCRLHRETTKEAKQLTFFLLNIFWKLVLQLFKGGSPQERLSIPTVYLLFDCFSDTISPAKI